MKQLLKSYKNKRCFITGHSGFKGSWLYKILEIVGAEVEGYSLQMEEPNHFDLLGYTNESLDIIDKYELSERIINFEPDIIFHLAAETIVLDSYQYPTNTFDTNIFGTTNLLDVCRTAYKPKAIIIITTDKVYQNHNLPLMYYKEDDPLGGYDPYSISKVCVEHLSYCYRKSFYKGNPLIATCRAGNILGGGDYGNYRIIPDIIRAICTTPKQKLEIRNPRATRPWQHVLSCLEGYLMLGQKLLEGNSKFEGAWNFGPDSKSMIDVETLIKKIKNLWDVFEYKITPSEKHEYRYLMLDNTKAKMRLKWYPKYNINETLEKTVEWYKEYIEYGNIITEKQIREFFNL